MPASRSDHAQAESLRRWSRLCRPAVVATVTAAVVTTIGLLDPNRPGNYPTCPFLALTGHWCPGCGTLRAIHAMAHLDLATALARNPATVLATAWLVGWFCWWVIREWRGQTRRWVAPGWLIQALAWGLVGYGVARNLPGMTWLSPA